jgi:hypothetical protein
MVFFEKFLKHYNTFAGLILSPVLFFANNYTYITNRKFYNRFIFDENNYITTNIASFIFFQTSIFVKSLYVAYLSPLFLIEYYSYNKKNMKFNPNRHIIPYFSLLLYNYDLPDVCNFLKKNTGLDK